MILSEVIDELINKECELVKQCAGNPIKLFWQAMDLHTSFSCFETLEEAVECASGVVGGIEIHDALAEDHGEADKEYSRLKSCIRALLPSEETRKLVDQLEDQVCALTAVEADIHLLVGLAIGLRFGGLSPKQIERKLAFMAEKIVEAKGNP